jgi:uncharacterized protein
MELVNDFTVNVPVDEAWVTLTDLERIAPCLPGAQLQEVDGDVYRGVVKVKVGPILAQFKGEAHFVERDVADHRAVIKAKGRDTGGKGNAEATITASMTAEGSATTKVSVTTDLSITGKVAQFGRGAMADVSTKLLGQFVDNLEATVLTGQGPGGAPGSDVPSSGGSTNGAPAAATAGSSASEPSPTSSGARRIDAPEAEPLDLMDAAGGAMLKRVAPLVLVVVLVLWFLRRRRA